MNRQSPPFMLARPLLVSTMVGLVGISIVEFTRLFLPDWNGSFLILGWMAISLEAFYSHWLLQVTPRRGGDRWKFRAIELMVVYLIIQATFHMGFGWERLLVNRENWLDAPLLLLGDPGGILMVLVGYLLWDAAGATATDLDLVDEPLEVSLGDGTIPAMSATTRTRLAPILAHERPRHPGPSPLERLSDRFFWGGGALLLFTALTHVGITRLLSITYTRVPGLVLNVLLYFLLGFVLLGQVRYALLHKKWEVEGLKIDKVMRGRWLRYSFILILLALSIAFLLPTGYTVDLLTTAGTLMQSVLMIISILFWVLYLLIIYPFLWLLWLLTTFTRGERAEPPRIQPEFNFVEPPPSPVGPAWFDLLRSLIFWLALLGMMAYVLHSYLRDRPELRSFLLSLAPVRLLARLWRGLWGELRDWAATVQANLPRALPGHSGQRPDRAFRFFRLGALPPRDRVLYYYQSLLKRARERGFPRGTGQTPYEYDETLKPHLSEAQRELERLTDAFVEARYSRHQVAPEMEEEVRSQWEQVRAALRRLQRNRTTDDAKREGPDRTEG